MLTAGYIAIRTAISELSSYVIIYLLARYNTRATVFVLIIPLIQMRIGMMVGNWGQHALVDESEPDSDFRYECEADQSAVNRILVRVLFPKWDDF